MNGDKTSRLEPETSRPSSIDLERALEEIERAIRGISYGSIEVVIQNSRVVQIERKQKFRFSAD
jgi:hypothetical protein